MAGTFICGGGRATGVAGFEFETGAELVCEEIAAYDPDAVRGAGRRLLRLRVPGARGCRRPRRVARGVETTRTT
ncbi:hypothetical protein BRD02_08345 [Halobacteriales archaeon QS_8_69_73]|nr:MAG: hypothetical protein BRD02_08345 [Halobacteriales archaeon QS_8_69_73]